MKRAFLTLIAIVAAATQLAAEPCVSPTFDVPFPGATDVESHVTDLPSSAFPAFWQEGQLDGYAYKIFANATGVVRGGDQDMSWAIEMMCDVTGATCTFSQTGTPPETATVVAERIGECLVPTTVIAEAPQELATSVIDEVNTAEVVTSPALVMVDPAAETQTTEPTGACGTAITNELTDIATMQRLLVLLGEDPGPVDGFLGPQSFAAMEAFMSNPGWGTSIPEFVSALSELHCTQAQ